MEIASLMLWQSCDCLLQCGAVTMQSIFTWILTKTPHSLPVRVSYRVSFVNIISDAYFASVIVIPYTKLLYAGARCNSTLLYIWLPQCKWSNPEENGSMEGLRTDNINTTNQNISWIYFMSYVYWIGHVTLAAIAGITILVPCHVVQITAMKLKIHAPVDEIYGCLIFKRVAVVWLDSLWPSDAILQHRSGWISAQVMPWCLMPPSH